VAPAILSDLFPIHMRGRVLSWFYTALPIGSAIGYVLGEQIAKSGIGNFAAQHFGVSSESWRWAFYLVIPPGLLLGVWSFVMRDPPKGQSENAPPARAIRGREYLIFLKTPSFVFCSLGMTCMTFAMGGIAVWMPYYLEHRPGAGAHSYPTTMFGVVLLVTGLLGTLLGGLVGDKLRTRFSGSYFLVSGVPMLIGFPLVWAMTHASFPGIWLYIFFACFCLFFNTAPASTILANVTHPAMRAAGYALNILVIHAFGDVLSPFLIGLISDKYTMDVAFRVVAFMFLLSGVLWIWGAKYLAVDTERAAHGLS
jgi:MFS family permease